MQAAIFTNNRVVCGTTHGHAASCLSEEEKDKSLSGWYDEAKKKFVYADQTRFFYMKEIVFIRHAHAVNDHLTLKGISQITTSIKHMSSFYKPGLQIYSSPTERCEHSAFFLSTHFSVPGIVSELFEEPGADDKIIAALDTLSEHAIVVTHGEFIRKAIAKIGGTFMSYIPNFCLMRLSGNHLDDMAVFYADDNEG